MCIRDRDIIVLNHLDYLDYSNKDSVQLTDFQKSFVKDIENKIGRKIDYFGNGEMSMISSSIETR